ncbi:MAG: DJ-1/PfpI family protein [Candidatus Omnitrophica bacterium]|nr:DJ-1/PfpI family protein [Candidatus Omnitrophota bacterium]
MKKRAIVILAQGCEEVEAITPIDILRRAGIEVISAGIGGTTIKSSRGIIFNADVKIEDIDFVPDVVIVPGGMPGAENISQSEKARHLIRDAFAKGKIVAALCASPAVVLTPLGILHGKKATCYPGMEESFTPDIKFVDEKVVQDGNVITSKGVGTALLFALKIVEALSGKAVADTVARAVVVMP